MIFDQKCGAVLLSEEEILEVVNLKRTGKFGRSALIPTEAKEHNYVMSCFVYSADYELWRFCQGINDNGELGFGAEIFSPSYEDY